MDPTDVQLCTKSQVTVEFEAHVQPTVASQLVTRVFTEAMSKPPPQFYGGSFSRGRKRM